MYQLPGQFTSPVPNQRPTVLPRLATLLIIWVMLAVGYFTYRFYTSAASSRPSPVSAWDTRTPEPAIDRDWQRHLADVGTGLGRTTSQTRNVQTLLRHILNQAESPTQAREMQRALGSLDDINHQLEQIREEVNFIEQQMKGQNIQ